MKNGCTFEEHLDDFVIIPCRIDFVAWHIQVGQEMVFLVADE